MHHYDKVLAPQPLLHTLMRNRSLHQNLLQVTELTDSTEANKRKSPIWKLFPVTLGIKSSLKSSVISRLTHFSRHARPSLRWRALYRLHDDWFSRIRWLKVRPAGVPSIFMWCNAKGFDSTTCCFLFYFIFSGISSGWHVLLNKIKTEGFFFFHGGPRSFQLENPTPCDKWRH